MDQWLETSSLLVVGQGFDAMCSRLSDYLSLRSFFVGYSLTAADLALWGQLQGKESLSGALIRKMPLALSEASLTLFMSRTYGPQRACGAE